MKKQKGFTLPELLIVIWLFIVFGCVGGLGYVVYHFMSKWW